MTTTVKVLLYNANCSVFRKLWSYESDKALFMLLPLVLTINWFQLGSFKITSAQDPGAYPPPQAVPLFSVWAGVITRCLRHPQKKCHGLLSNFFTVSPLNLL